MQKIFLGGKYGSVIGNYALVDDADFESVNKFKWCSTKGKKTYYARRYIYVNGKQTSLPLHRFIMNETNRGIEIDHENHNGLDNQKHNLRVATISQNHANRISRKIFIGVIFNKRNKNYTAVCQKSGNRYYKCGLLSEAEAAKAYNEFAIKHHGSFAKLNIIG